MECALFYPYTEPPTPWLKQALLYYDVLGSVVQPSFTDAASADVAWLIDRGIFEPVHIDDLDRHHSDRLIEEVVEVVSSGPPPLKVPAEARLHVELNEGKLPRRIVAELIELGVIHENSSQLLVEQQVLGPLLCVMAKHAAATFSVPGRTYSLHTTCSDATHLAFSPLEDDRSRAALTIALRTILPIPGDNVTFDDILDFKASHRADLLGLRRSVERIAVEVSASSRQAESIVGVLTERIEEERLRLRTAMLRRGWRAGTAVVVAVAAGVAGAHLAPGATPWVFSGVGSAVLSATVLAVRSRPMPEFSYLHDAAALG